MRGKLVHELQLLVRVRVLGWVRVMVEFGITMRAWPVARSIFDAPYVREACRFTTYRHRFARAAPAPRAKRKDSKNRGRASPVKEKRTSGQQVG